MKVCFTTVTTCLFQIVLISYYYAISVLFQFILKYKGLKGADVLLSNKEANNSYIHCATMLTLYGSQPNFCLL